ncbi:hypothetical protein Tco_0584769, partial [Tanacetum coccineum]
MSQAQSSSQILIAAQLVPMEFQTPIGKCRVIIDMQQSWKTVIMVKDEKDV